MLLLSTKPTSQQNSRRSSSPTLQTQGCAARGRAPRAEKNQHHGTARLVRLTPRQLTRKPRASDAQWTPPGAGPEEEGGEENHTCLVLSNSCTTNLKPSQDGLADCLWAHGSFCISILLRPTGLEHLPEAQRFISARGQHCGFIRRKSQPQDASFVPGQCRQFLETRVPPNIQLIVYVPMSRHQLLVVRVPDQRTNLRPTVRGSNAHSISSVPQLDLPVRGASSCGQKATVPRTPRDGFHRSFVLPE
mmetsp:Transcript_88006/g.201076  ORF Transcript_88006/g.201076 Transcript_88006/m.201076 type:complete len:247 (-) Transcript_88006:919-1659(-)